MMLLAAQLVRVVALIGAAAGRLTRVALVGGHSSCSGRRGSSSLLAIEESSICSQPVERQVRHGLLMLLLMLALLLAHQ